MVNIGVIVSDKNPIAALRKARSLGFSICQLYAPSKDWHSGERFAELMKEVQREKVRIVSSVCAFEGEDYSSVEAIRRTVGLVNPETRESRIRWIFSCSDLARRLGIKVLQGHIGFIPQKKDPQYRSLVESVRKMLDYLADNGGQSFALETGQETADELLQFVEAVDRPNLKVNFDPANFLIYNTDDPLRAVAVLKDYIVGVHCKDARRPREKGVLGSEVPLGEGEVDIPAVIARLNEFDYAGPFIIEREVGGEEQWRKDVLKAKYLLESLLQKL